MATKKKAGPAKKAPSTMALPTISMEIDGDLFSRAHNYRYRPDVRMSLKAVVAAALDEYLKARSA